MKKLIMKILAVSQVLILISCVKEDRVMVNVDQLRKLIIRPTLKFLEPEIPYSLAAENLLVMTAAHESHLGYYFKQVNGPAEGIYQMEPNTASDIWDNYLEYNPELAVKVNMLCSPSDMRDCIGNLFYATALARVHYRRVPDALPLEDDYEGLANYAKDFYNTHLGKAKWEQYHRAYVELTNH